MSGAARVCQVQMFEDRCDPALIRVELNGGPGEIVMAAGVFRLDADEMRVAGLLSVPLALARVIAAASGDHVEGAVASQSELRERSRQIRTAVDDRPQAWHVAAAPWSRGVMADHAFHGSDVAAAPGLPSIDERDLQSGVLQHFRKPGE